MKLKIKTLTTTCKAFLEEKWRLTPASLMNFLTKGAFVRYRHIKYIDNIIARAVAKGNARIIVSLPPRHGKSWLLSKALCVWFLSLWPDRKIILASYGANLATDFSKDVRNFLAEHSDQLNVSLRDDSQASDRWHTTEGGGMLAAGIMGPITGFGGQLLLIDDPLKNWEECQSDLTLKKQIEWFNSTFLTRAEPGASIIIIMTRWHEGDLAGHLLNEKNGGWQEIRLPAIAEENDPLGRQVGEALCPERYPIETLNAIQGAMGPMMFNALFQQDPTPDSTALVRREWIHFHDKTDFCEYAISWDTSFKKGASSDYAVGVVVGRRTNDRCFYVVDIVRKKMSFTECLQEMRILRSRYPSAMMLIEQAANGSALHDSLKSEMHGLILRPATDSKHSRLMSIVPNFQAGDILFPNTEVAKICIEEVIKFPNSRNDDCVDALTQCLIYLKGSGWASRQSVENFKAKTEQELFELANSNRSNGGIDPHGIYGFWGQMKKQRGET